MRIFIINNVSRFFLLRQLERLGKFFNIKLQEKKKATKDKKGESAVLAEYRAVLEKFQEFDASFGMNNVDLNEMLTAVYKE